MDIHQSGRHHESGGLDNFGALLLCRRIQFAGRLDGGDPSVFEEQIPIGIDARRGIDQVATANQNRGQFRLLALAVLDPAAFPEVRRLLPSEPFRASASGRLCWCAAPCFSGVTA